eukprot:COSAG06_NODE_4159_length_4511_cov_12.444470_1_plen_498_part_00
MTTTIEPPTVTLRGLGDLQGEPCPDSGSGPQVIRFLDVPFAAPPVGAARWTAPSPPEPWGGLRTNPRVLTRCPQPWPKRRGQPPTFEGHTLEDSEDCLKLAIWAPLAALEAAAESRAEAEAAAQLAAIEAAEEEADGVPTSHVQAHRDAALSRNYGGTGGVVRRLNQLMEEAEAEAEAVQIIDASLREEINSEEGESKGDNGSDPWDSDSNPIPGASQAGNVAKLLTRDDAAASAAATGDAESDAATSSEADHLLPIVFYVHGGGGKHGSCHSPAHSGEALARTQDVVFISCNYRLGIFGFLAHPALSQEDQQSTGEGCCGNYAISDMIMALSWVQEHAAALGGDKDNVTIMGLSSGAQYVSTLLVSPPCRDPKYGMDENQRPKGLFHRAFIQSCVDLPNVRKLQTSCGVWLQKSAEDWGEELAGAMGCPFEEDAELADSYHLGQLASLRKLPVEVLLEHTWDEAATDCYESARLALPLASAVAPSAFAAAFLRVWR